MKKNKLSESKIIELLKRIEKGADIETTIREYGISFYIRYPHVLWITKKLLV